MKRKLPYPSSFSSPLQTFRLTDGMKHYVRRNNCFDLLRYLFALLIVAFHFSVLTHAEWSEMMVQSGPLSVKAFFVMTGFLVAYSFLQHEHHLQKYFRKRFERILPAYVLSLIHI